MIRAISGTIGERLRTAALIIVAVTVVVSAGAIIPFAPIIPLAVFATLLAVGAVFTLVHLVSDGIAPAANARLLPVSLAIVLVSLIPIELRDPTAESLGVQAIYEFSLQGAALALMLLALSSNEIRVPMSPGLVLWLVFAGIAVLSAFWAPSSQLAALKGLQLFTLVLVVATAAFHFRDRYQAVRFLSWLAILIVFGAVVIQGVSSGPESLIVGYEYGRQRLTLLAIHPLVLGGFTGTVASILLVNGIRGWDWFAFFVLASVTLAANARVPLFLLVVVAVAYLLLRSNHLSYMRHVGIILGFVLAIVFFAGWFVSANSSLELFSAVVPELNSQDIQTLNGRIPLWQAVFEYGEERSNAALGILAGNGFASFRYLGLNLFGYGGNAHNAVIQVLFELGVIGLVVWIAAIGACGWGIYRYSGNRRTKLVYALPLFYIVAIQMMEASLSDSRSFMLVILLFYGHLAAPPTQDVAVK